MPKSKDAIVKKAKKQKCSKKETAARIQQSRDDRRTGSAPKSVVRRASRTRSRRGNKSHIVRAPALAYGRRIKTQSTEMVRLVRKNVLFSQMICSSTVSGVHFNSYDLSPTNSNLFPWLTPIAGCFEEYKIESFRVRFEPIVPATQAGYVGLAISYNAQDDVPTDEGTFFTYKSAVRNSIWQECSTSMRATKWLFTKPQVTPADSDLKTYYAGKLFTCCLSDTASLVCGQLFYDISIQFRKPRKSTYEAAVTTDPGSNAANTISPNDIFAPSSTDLLTYGDSSFKRLSDSMYQFHDPGKYVLPIGYSKEGSGSVTGAGTPAQATINSQLTDLWSGYQAPIAAALPEEPGTWTQDQTRAAIYNVGDALTQAYFPGGSDAMASFIANIVVDILKPNTIVDVGTDSSGSDAQWFNASDGWGDLWSLAESGWDIVTQAAPYALSAITALLSPGDAEYRRRRRLGYYDCYHIHELKCPTVSLTTKEMRVAFFPEDLWLIRGETPLIKYPETVSPEFTRHRNMIMRYAKTNPFAKQFIHKKLAEDSQTTLTRRELMKLGVTPTTLDRFKTEDVVIVDPEKDEDVTTTRKPDNKTIERDCISCGLVMKLRSRNERMFCDDCLVKVYSDVPPKN
jgi:hypothetical protein